MYPDLYAPFLDKEAAEDFERQASEYTYQFGNVYNFPFDSPFDPDAKSHCVRRAPEYDIKEVELKGL